MDEQEILGLLRRLKKEAPKAYRHLIGLLRAALGRE